MKTELKTEVEKYSYAIGMNTGFSFKQFPEEIDTDALIQGFKDIISDAQPLLNREDFVKTMEDFQKKLEERKNDMAKSFEANKKVGNDFLAENKDKEGVVTTDSGLQYIVLDEGDGEMPTADSTVTVHYKGTLINDTEFDSSYKRGEPATFPVNGVIPGWTEALQLMKIGSKYKLFIPSDLAYAERGAGEIIPPHSALIFEVELIGIN